MYGWRIRRPLAAQGPVSLVDLSVAEESVQALQGLGGLGQDHDAAYGTVQAVGNAHEHLPGLAVPPGDEGLEGLGEGFVAGLVALDDFSGALVQHQ